MSRSKKCKGRGSRKRGKKEAPDAGAHSIPARIPARALTAEEMADRRWSGWTAQQVHYVPENGGE